MKLRVLELNIISAKDLNDVRHFGKMKVYSTVTLLSSKQSNIQEAQTEVDEDNGINPAWNFHKRFTIDESAAKQNLLTLKIKLLCERTLGEKEVGEVQVPLKELVDYEYAGDGSSFRHLSYPVRDPSGEESKGRLNISYKWTSASVGDEDGNQPPSPSPSVNEQKHRKRRYIGRKMRELFQVLDVIVTAVLIVKEAMDASDDDSEEDVADDYSEEEE